MSNRFVPHTPEKMVVIEVSVSEALVIQELREFSFGKLTVHKADNKVVRVEPLSSKIINENQKLTIPIVNKPTN